MEALHIFSSSITTYFSLLHFTQQQDYKYGQQSHSSICKVWTITLLLHDDTFSRLICCCSSFLPPKRFLKSKLNYKHHNVSMQTKLSHCHCLCPRCSCVPARKYSQFRYSEQSKNSALALTLCCEVWHVFNQIPFVTSKSVVLKQNVYIYIYFVSLWIETQKFPLTLTVNIKWKAPNLIKYIYTSLPK